MWSILIILIVSLAAAGLAVWMPKGISSSCGFSCSCCTRCDEMMRKLSTDKTPAEKKET